MDANAEDVQIDDCFMFNVDKQHFSILPKKNINGVKSEKPKCKHKLFITLL